MSDFVGCSNYYNCQNIQDSQYVVNSSDIDFSSFVHDSTQVSHSTDVFKSNDVTNSLRVFESEFVYNSEKIYKSNNIEDSNNIILSKGVYNSRNIYTCENIMSCGELRHCDNMTDSAFCADSKNLKNCLFCYGLEDREYHIFNKPVDKARFDVVFKQYQRLMGGIELDYTREPWPESMLVPMIPNLFSYYHKHYRQLDDRFWRWSRSVPNFDADLLYKITLNFDLY